MSNDNERVFSLIERNEEKARLRHEDLIQRVTRIEDKANCDGLIKLEKKFEEHVKEDKWKSYGKELVRLFIYGIATISGFKIWGK